MPDQFWNIIGALTIFAAMIASHPLRPATAEQFEARFEARLQEMMAQPCDPMSAWNSCSTNAWIP